MTPSLDDGALLIEEEEATETFVLDDPAPDAGPSAPGGEGRFPSGSEQDRLAGGELLSSARFDVEELLQQVPSGLIEARRFISVALWPSPRPEELQAIVKLATDLEAPPARRHPALTLLALRLLAEREARSFWEDLPLDPDEIRFRAHRVAGVIASLEAFGDPSKPTWTSESRLDSDDREYLAKLAAPLLPRPDRLVAATILAPRLAVLLEKEAGGLNDLLPSVSREEARILGEPMDGTDELAIPLKRTCLHVAAARWLMHDDLFEWDALAPAEPAAPPAPETAATAPADDGSNAPAETAPAPALEDLDEARRSKLVECLKRLREDELVYRAVSTQLQSLQDHALKVRRKDLSDLLIRLRRPMLTAYTRLAGILRSPAAATLSRPHGGATARPEGDGAAQAAEAEHVEKIYDAAVTSLKARPATFLRRLTPALRQRRRIIALSATLVCLLAAAPIVLWNLPQAPDPPLEFNASDSIVLKLLSATPVGTMLYARVDDYWTRLSPGQRREKLDDLARLATEKGFESLYLTDAQGEPVARWDIAHGATILGSGAGASAPLPAPRH